MAYDPHPRIKPTRDRMVSVNASVIIATSTLAELGYPELVAELRMARTHLHMVMDALDAMTKPEED